MPFILLAILAGLLLPSYAHAAGGHHAVDDAAILDPGQCNVELWAERSTLDRRRLQHLGTACHLAGVELGLNLDRDRSTAPASDGTTSAAPALHARGLQAKWATALRPDLSIGLVGALSWQDQAPRVQQSLLVPLSWTPREDLALHLNLGRSFRAGAADRAARGIAVEWQPVPAWQGLAEWFDDGLRPLARLGLRRYVGEQVSLDLSYAKTTSARRAPAEGWWTLGLTWEFGR